MDCKNSHAFLKKKKKYPTRMFPGTSSIVRGKSGLSIVIYTGFSSCQYWFSFRAGVWNFEFEKQRKRFSSRGRTIKIYSFSHRVIEGCIETVFVQNYIFSILFFAFHRVQNHLPFSRFDRDIISHRWWYVREWFLAQTWKTNTESQTGTVTL